MTRSTEEGSLSWTKAQRQAANLTREDYWITLQTNLRCAYELQEVISGNVQIVVEMGRSLVRYRLPGSLRQSVSLILDPEDIRSVPFTLVAEGQYEPFLENLILAFARQSEFMCDIGANVGFYSVAAAVVNPEIRVLAFEPNESVGDTLSLNAQLNDVSANISLHRAALSDQPDGFLEFFVPRFTGSGGGSLRDLHPEEGAPKVASVAVSRLDDVLKDERPPDFIKIDVEGAELAVLKGGRAVLANSHPTLVVELLRKWMRAFGSHPQEVVDLLREGGYEAFAISSAGLRPVDVIDEQTQETNFLFLHACRSDHLSLVRALSPVQQP